MESIVKKTSKRAAFTIIELLTVMSIIVILFGLLAPAMTMVRRYAKRVKQEAQFHSIEAGLQMFHDDFDGYPDSADDSTNPYPGAMKLAEALVGRDMLGFHPSSMFNFDGTDEGGVQLYPITLNPDPTNPTDPDLLNLRSRKGPYVQVDRANVYPILEVFSNATGLGNAQTDPNRALVLCDEYPRVRNNVTGKRVGMPILYYKANVSNVKHVPADGTGIPTVADDDKGNIYNHLDNQKIVELGLTWSNDDHPMLTTTQLFYDNTRNPKISFTGGTFSRPYNPESYILISAGFDGLYGTEDDVFNFEN